MKQQIDLSDVTELSKRLSGQDGLKVSHDVKKRLVDLQRLVDQQLDEGLKTSEFETLSKLKSSIASAYSIVVSYSK